ncbi:hypothetical protein AAHB37_04350 [Glutamicibacter halophytocola]|uniref:hypothetical protein n=1 Tax=Glutamicibacter halophytocola TaxID=1933880 RepID=UPI00321B94EB
MLATVLVVLVELLADRTPPRILPAAPGSPRLRHRQLGTSATNWFRRRICGA